MRQLEGEQNGKLDPLDPNEKELLGHVRCLMKRSRVRESNFVSLSKAR